MTHIEILDYIDEHYEEFPNFDGRTPADILRELPSQDARYALGADGLRDILDEIAYLT